ncbi:MAG: serine/threonine protein kinase [Polyangiaceae bacterium]|nr:serine/threonine protein kinase [Polyangiaceae bacterium]
MTAPNFAPGTAVAGKFSVRSLLGYGGASATFRAVSQQGRDVALKAYSPAIGQRRDVMDQLQRYVAETNALPQDLVAPILEAGYDPATATPFTITDFISTPSVAQLVMHRPMAIEEVGAMLRTLAAVLDAAHAREVFHLALKPTNLFIDPNAPGNLRVIDFGVGLARAVAPTQEGYVVAAPWMAPEQMQQGAQPGAAADVFSAALVAFFALTGRSFWRSCQGAPDLNGWQREISGPRPAASARAAELGAQLNPSLDAAFARALAVDPRERFRSVGELAAALGGFPSAAGRAPQNHTIALGDAYAAVDPGPPRAPAEQPGYGAGYPPLDQALPVQTAPAQPAQESPSGAATHIPQPTMAQLPAGATRTPSGKAAPVVVGVVAVLLLGGAAAAWFLLGKSSSPEAPGPIASASTSAAPPASESAPPPTPPPPDSAVAAGDTPDAGPAEAADAAPEDAPVKITCSPEACDSILIDDKAVANPDDIRLKPGKHKVSVRRTGFLPQTDMITVEAGKPFEKDYALQKVAASSPGPRPTPKRDCSKLKLLERQRCERGQ